MRNRVSRGIFDPRRIIVLAAIVLSTGCVVPPHRGVVPEIPGICAQYVTKYFPVSLYRLSPGDVLEFLYLTLPTVRNEPYQLSVGDQVDVEFHFQPVMNRTVRVRPDGKISIPRKNDVMAAGLSAEQLKRDLTKIYSDILKNPEITVTVREYNARLAELQRAIATAPHGQARLISVNPDGHISLPLIPTIRAEGLTVPEITNEANKLYAKLISDMKVSVFLKEVVGNLVFVDGEVRNPGVFTMKGPTTVQHALTLAGGTTDTAEPRSVLVISRGPDGRLATRVTNLAALTSETDHLLTRNDLVYVPKSVIARADTWVNQNITKLLLFTGWGLGLTQDVGRTTTR